MPDGYCNELCMLGGDRTFPFTFPEYMHTQGKGCLGEQGRRHPDREYMECTGSDISVKPYQLNI